MIVSQDSDRGTEMATHNQRHDIKARYQNRRSRSLALIERMLRSYLRPYLWLLGISILANIIVAVTTGALPWFIQQAIDKVFTEQDQQMLVLIPAGVVAISLMRGVATYGSNVIMSFVGQRSTSNLQRDLFARLVRGDLAYVSSQHTGEYISLFMNDATRLRDTVSGIIISLVRHLLTIVALIIFMFSVNWQLALIYTIIVVPMGISSMRRLGKVTRTASRKGLEETGGLSTLIAETLGGLRIVKAYGQEEHQIKRAATVIDRVLDFTMTALRARAAPGRAPSLRLTSCSVRFILPRPPPRRRSSYAGRTPLSAARRPTYASSTRTTGRRAAWRASKARTMRRADDAPSR